MTDIRTLTTGEAIFSLDFVIKLIRKVHKDHPKYTIEQVAAMVTKVFGEKLATMEKRLANIEKIRAQYQALKSSEPIVKGVLETLLAAKAVEVKPIAGELLLAKQPAKKANGAANHGKPEEAGNQPNLPL